MTHDNWQYGDSSANTPSTFLFILLLTVATVVVSCHRNRSPGSTLPRETPLNMLHKRYDRGEIDKKEFDEKRRDLTQ